MSRRRRRRPRRRQFVVQASLPVVQRPATPEQQRRGGIVAVEPGSEHANFLRVASTREPSAQRPLGAERPNLFAEPGVDRRVGIRERALPAVRGILERKRRIERAEPHLLLVCRARDRPPVHVGFVDAEPARAVIDVVGHHARAQRRRDAAVVLGEQADRLDAIVGIAQLAEPAFGPGFEIRGAVEVRGTDADEELVAIAFRARARRGAQQCEGGAGGYDGFQYRSHDSVEPCL